MRGLLRKISQKNEAEMRNLLKLCTFCGETPKSLHVSEEFVSLINV